MKPARCEVYVHGRRCRRKAAVPHENTLKASGSGLEPPPVLVLPDLLACGGSPDDPRRRPPHVGAAGGRCPVNCPLHGIEIGGDGTCSRCARRRPITPSERDALASAVTPATPRCCCSDVTWCRDRSDGVAACPACPLHGEGVAPPPEPSAAPGLAVDELYVPPSTPKHVLYIDCDGVPLKLSEPPALDSVKVTITGDELVLQVRAPLDEETGKFLAQLAKVLADRRAERVGSWFAPISEAPTGGAQ